MRKTARKLHRWLSLPFGVIVLIICLSGAILSFEKELSGHAGPAARQSAVLPQADLHKQPATPLSVSSSQSNQPASQAQTKKHHRQRTPFFMTVFKLHRWLLIDSPREVKFSWGRTLTGTTTVAFIGIVISGLIMWWPRSKAGFNRSMRITTHRGSYALLHSLHIVAGVTSAFFLLIMAMTGLYWTFSIGGLDKRFILGLHTGAIGGFPLRLIFMFAALSGVLLVVTGYGLWWQKRR